jgi:hypothetical protein
MTKVVGDVDYDLWYRVYQDKRNGSEQIRFRAKPGETKDLGTIRTKAPPK